MKHYLKKWLPTAEKCIEICKLMYPVKGLIVSPDINRAFELLIKEVPSLQLHRYPSGMTAEDWVVPDSWELLSATLKDESGEIIASHDEHFLFVAPYSESVDGWFTKTELIARCRTNQTVPDSYCLEHRNAYNHQLNDWGITLPYNRLQQLSDQSQYQLTIQTKTEPGELLVGEWVLPGKRSETICICSQFDELINDGQSSAVLGALVMQKLAKLPQREYTYQLLLVPEMFGTLFYAFHERDTLNNTVAMLNLETLGAGEQWILKKAFKEGGALENSLRITLQQLDIAHKEVDFFSGYGNDERVYGWPTIGIPGPGIQRFPFKEYHTDLDCPNILDPRLLAEAAAIIFETLLNFDRNYIPKYRQFLQPWLTKHGLYTESLHTFSNLAELNNQLLYHIDGKTSLLELAQKTAIPYDIIYQFLEMAVEKSIIEKTPCTKENLRK